ncbi:MAG TPA: HEAT repeat domain-containing protein [Pirellulales bacterium]|nr:HEAT repeat domain-containing protein [Pirellulales bacterium]
MSSEKRWLRISLRTFFVLFTCVSIALAWFAHYARQRWAAFAAIRQAGGNVQMRIREPSRLEKWFGAELFGTVNKWNLIAFGLALAAIVAVTMDVDLAAEPAPSAENRTDEHHDASREDSGDRVESKPQTALGVARSRSRERLRFASRSFEQWRDQLLDDLDPNTCIQAISPLVAFGKKGYADEAVAALAVVLRDDRQEVVDAASNALAQLGTPAVAVLIDGLSDDRPHVRAASARELRPLGAAASPATDALVKLLSDDVENVRLQAAQSLPTVAGQNDALTPIFERLASSNEVSVRRAFISGLATNPPRGGLLLRLLIHAASDDDMQVRWLVAQSLSGHGPPNDDVIEALKRLLRDNQQQVWNTTLLGLIDRNNTHKNAATKAIVLADALSSPQGLALLRQTGSWANGDNERIVDVFVNAREQTDLIVQAMTEIVDGNVEGWQPLDVLYAIDALGRLGPAAKRAVPSLERWVFGEKRFQGQFIFPPSGETVENLASRVLRKIAAVEDDASRGDR